MALARTLAASFAPLVDLIYPPRCPRCGEAIAAQTGLCTPCWSELEVPRGDAESGVFAATLYNDASRDLVLAFKYSRKLSLAPMMARLMAARLEDQGGDWVLVPVPLHRWRLWRRGFNQSAMLARELASLTSMALLVDGLVRKKSTRSLGGLGAIQRQAELAGAIAPNPARTSSIKGANVMLVDDVLTSGATSEACIAALKEAGAARVRLVCFARTRDL